MYELLSSVVMSGALGAQCVLTLVLLKGDICPGQRGRLHKAFWFIVAAWLVVIPFSSFSILPFIALGVFSLRSKSGKTRLSGPIPVLHLANGFGALAVLVSAWQQGTAAGLLMIAQVVLVGAITAHCLLVRARSRLQAFHRILPVVGIVASMVMAVIIAVASASMPEAEANSLITSVLSSLGLVLCGVVIWALHLLRQTTPHIAQLCCALIVIASASGVAMSAMV